MEEKIKHEPQLHEKHEVRYESMWIKVKENNGYFYAERFGIDSIAFVLFAINSDDDKVIGLVKELKDPVEQYVISAFGGSIDDKKYHNDLKNLVIDEALEESGFNITEKDIAYYGKSFVSTQMNQFCHLFGVTVDKYKQGIRTTTNVRELDSTIVWLSVSEVMKLEDWKAITILAKRMSSSSAVFIQKNKQTIVQNNS